MTGTDLFLVGGLSRAVVSTMLCPVTLVKTRMEWGGGGAAASGYQYKVQHKSYFQRYSCLQHVKVLSSHVQKMTH